MAVTMRPASTPDLDLILQTIRSLESGNNYTAQNRTSSASGAYQYVDSTWGGYGGYKHAKDAPPYIQDQKARQDVQRILQSHGNDVSAVPQFWYYPAGYGRPNLVPPGNTLSMGQYTDKWMKVYTSLGGSASYAGFSGSPTPLQLASSRSSSDQGSYQEHDVFGVNLPWPLSDIHVKSNTARAVAGAMILFGGGLVTLLGLSLLVLGKSPVPLPGPAGIAQGAMNKFKSRPDADDKRYDAALEQGRQNQANAPRTSVGGQKMIGYSEEPF